MTRSVVFATLVLGLALALARGTDGAPGANCNTDDDCFDRNNQGYCTPQGGTPGFRGVCAACHPTCNTCAGPDSDECTSCTRQDSNPLARVNNVFPSGFTPVPARTTTGSCNRCLTAAPGPNPTSAQCTDAVCPGFYLASAPIGGSSSCNLCDPTCKTCSGPSPTQCTSCPEDSFQTSGSTSGPSACLACADQRMNTACTKANCPMRYFVPDQIGGSMGNCNACDPSCAMCNGGGTNQCTACKEPEDEEIFRQQRTFLSFFGAGAGSGSGTCLPCTSASGPACTTANCPGFFFDNANINSNGNCIACSKVSTDNFDAGIGFCTPQNCPNFFITQTVGDPLSASQTCYNCTLANTAGECSPRNCPAYVFNQQGTSIPADDTCDARSSTTVPTVAPTPTPTVSTPTPTVSTPTPTASTPTPTAPTPGGAVPNTCTAANEYRAPGGCAKCVTANSPFKQRLGGFSCVNAITFSAQSTSCIPFSLKASSRKAGTDSTSDTCIQQTRDPTDNIVSILLPTTDSKATFLESASYVKSSLRLNGVKPRETPNGQVVFVTKGNLRLVQFVDRFREIRGKAPKDIFLTGVLRPFNGATTNYRCFKTAIRVCA